LPSLGDFVPTDKTCSHCNALLPLNAMHFDRDNAAPDGFRDDCKQCRSEKRKKQHDEGIDDRLGMLDRAALEMLGTLAAKDYSKLPHIAEVFECLMRVFGGPQGYAQHVLGTYLTANPGSQQRIKLLNIISMMANQVTQTGAARVPKELMNDEDLEREAEELAKRVFGPPRIVTVEDKDVA
jgi:hypothetical protein